MNRSRSIAIFSIILITALILSLAALVGPALAEMGPWNRVDNAWSGDANNTAPISTAIYKGNLYTGTFNTVSGCEVWRFDGAGWTQVNLDGFGVATNWGAYSMIVYDGYLYVGTLNAIGAGGEIWRTAAVGGPPFTDWTRVNAGGFGDPNNVGVFSMTGFGQYLYAGTVGGQVWRTRAVGGPPFTDWVQVNNARFGDPNNTMIWSMAVYKSHLYAAVENDTTGCELWATAGTSGPPYTDWVLVNTDGFGAAANRMLPGLTVKGSYLYAGMGGVPVGGPAQLWRTAGAGGPPYTDWVKVAPDGFGDAQNKVIFDTISDGSYIYAGTGNGVTGCEVWRSACSGGPPFTDWTQVNNDGFGDVKNDMVTRFVFYNANLFAPTPNANGAQVWRSITSHPTWYLAEGTTAWGFDEYITIENPNNVAVNAAITYMTNTGPVNGPNVALPAASQATVDPKPTVPNQDFSTRVSCTEGLDIAVDRTMSWTGTGAASPEGHNSVGVTAPSTNWYLPEGSSEWGFETWLLIQNPNPVEATCQVTYMIEGAAAQTFQKLVPANSRRTYNMAADIGKHDASIFVESNLPVIPERAMYRNDRREGHDSIGTTSPAHDFYLAEGATAWGFTNYVLVQNPQPTATDVTVTYMTPVGPVQQPVFQMPANSRKTIRVNDIAGVNNTDLSTQVHGSQPIIAERAMYWDNGTGEACHDSIGMPLAHTSFYLPDGQTSEGRETWTLVQNPNATAVQVEVSYLTPTGAGNVTFIDNVGANSRKTYNMVNSGINGRAAVMVRSLTPNNKIMVERAMYWNSRGAGTDTIGGSAD